MSDDWEIWGESYAGLELTMVESHSMSIGWNEDGTLRVEENGEVVTGSDAQRIVGAFGAAVGWPILEEALDPDGSKRAKG